MSSFDSLLSGLKGVAEASRLRIVAILLHGELTVTELTVVLEQSQPRVSRHLKLLSDAGVVERHQEGSWVFYRLADHPLVRLVRHNLPRDDRQLRNDLARLARLHRAHQERAARYFDRNAKEWDSVRGRYSLEGRVGETLLELVGERRFERHVDLGTGTGRMLQLLAPRVRSAVGIDNSREMLAVARANLAGERFAHCQARYGDISQPDVDDGSADLVTIHHVLHFLENPAVVIEQAARILAPGGVVLVVDFAPHGNERLREEFAHRRLGFEPREIAAWVKEAGLACERTVSLPDESGAGDSRLDVLIWVGGYPLPEALPAANHIHPLPGTQ